MDSCVYVGHVWHRRRRPRPHEFTYRTYVFCLALDEMPSVADRLRWWSWNRPNLFSHFGVDHLDGRVVDLDRAVRQLLASHGITCDGRIHLVTQCRVFGYVFNPVSFYFCCRADGTLAALVAEVTSTFGERHLYVLDSLTSPGSATLRFGATKALHVSPFVSMNATYDFRVQPLGDQLSVTILEREHGEPVLDARVWGDRVALTDRTLVGLLWRYPLMTARVMAAIHWHALRLWTKGLRVYPQPGASEAQLAQQRELHALWSDEPPSSRGARG